MMRKLRIIAAIHAHIERKPERVFRWNRVCNAIWFTMGGKP